MSSVPTGLACNCVSYHKYINKSHNNYKIIILPRSFSLFLSHTHILDVFYLFILLHDALTVNKGRLLGYMQDCKTRAAEGEVTLPSQERVHSHEKALGVSQLITIQILLSPFAFDCSRIRVP